MSRAGLVAISAICAIAALSIPWIVSYVIRDVEFISRVWWGGPLVFTSVISFILLVFTATFCAIEANQKP